MIKIGNQVYSRKYILEYAEKNKDSLLRTKSGGVIVSNQGGLCLVVSKTGRMYTAWAGELELQWPLFGGSNSGKGGKNGE